MHLHRNGNLYTLNNIIQLPNFVHESATISYPWKCHWGLQFLSGIIFIKLVFTCRLYGVKAGIVENCDLLQVVKVWEIGEVIEISQSIIRECEYYETRWQVFIASIQCGDAVAMEEQLLYGTKSDALIPNTITVSIQNLASKWQNLTESRIKKKIFAYIYCTGFYIKNKLSEIYYKVKLCTNLEIL